MTVPSITLDEAVEATRTGDVWVFRGRTPADRMIQLATNSPVNHVGMSVVMGDLPALMWHAELGRSLPDLWSGSRQRGVQLHDLRDAVLTWATKYGDQAWLRQLNPLVTPDMEDAVLRTIARLDGTPFPSTTRLASRWLAGRVPSVGRIRRGTRPDSGGSPSDAGGARPDAGGSRSAGSGARPDAGLETAYCAEVLALTYQAMGLLPAKRRPNWYDAGRFWSGDDLSLSGDFELGGEIAVRMPATAPRARTRS